MHLSRSVLACCVASLTAAMLACGGSTPTAPSTSATTTGAVFSTGQGVAITWGYTGVYFLYSGAGSPLPPNDNLVLIGNFIKRLGAGRATDGAYRVFYTTRRPASQITDPQNRSWYGPFLDTVARIGTVDFGFPSRVDLSSYTVVVYDPCETLPNPEGERAAVQQYLMRGGRVLVLGDNFCKPTDDLFTRDLANALLSGLGISFTAAETAKRDPVGILPELQTGVLEGVHQLWVFRVAPQIVSGAAVPLVRDGANVLSAMVTVDPR